MSGLLRRWLHRVSSTKEARRQKKKRTLTKLDGDSDDALLTLGSPLSNETSFTHRTGTTSGGRSHGLPPTLHRPQQDPYHSDDNSLPTLDPDYNHSGTYSLSDAGGTIGTQSQSLANFTHGGASECGSANPAAAALIASRAGADHAYPAPPPAHPGPPSQAQPAATELLEVFAPAGKLGLVVDTPPGAAAPVVHAIKDTCPLRDVLRVDDRLVAVDEVDVRGMQATEVSRLLGRRSGQEWRRLTLVRAPRGAAGTLGPGLFKC